MYARVVVSSLSLHVVAVGKPCTVCDEAFELCNNLWSDLVEKQTLCVDIGYAFTFVLFPDLSESLSKIPAMGGLRTWRVAIGIFW